MLYETMDKNQFMMKFEKQGENSKGKILLDKSKPYGYKTCPYLLKYQ